jgi:hypothetical protein
VFSLPKDAKAAKKRSFEEMADATLDPVVNGTVNLYQQKKQEVISLKQHRVEEHLEDLQVS